MNKITATVFAAAVGLSACTSQPLTNEQITRADTERLCERVAITGVSARLYAKKTDVSPSTAKQLQVDAIDREAMLAELSKRGFTPDEIRLIANGKVHLGMRREAAACSWGASLLNKSIGYGIYSEQWGNGHGDYFYVNGAGRVDFMN